MVFELVCWFNDYATDSSGSSAQQCVQHHVEVPLLNKPFELLMTSRCGMVVTLEKEEAEVRGFVTSSLGFCFGQLVANKTFGKRKRNRTLWIPFPLIEWLLVQTQRFARAWQPVLSGRIAWQPGHSRMEPVQWFCFLGS